MKPKLALYLVMIVGLLVPMFALPVTADEGDVTMWVHRARLAHTGRSSSGTDAMVAFIHVRDATLDMVEGATVTGVWSLPDGTESAVAGVTNEQGIAIFSIWAGSGDYTFCVDDVTKAGWVYDPTLDREVCPVFTGPACNAR